MTTLRARLEQAETRLSELEDARARGDVNVVDDRLLGRVAEKTQALNEELEALEILGQDAVQDMSQVIEQGIDDLEQDLAGIETRTPSSGG